MTNWKEIPGHPVYMVSDDGQVLSRARFEPLVMKQALTPNGYLRVQVDREQHFVHRLMAFAFLPNPENLPVVRHLDDVGTHNVIENLAWGTYRDNALDSIELGNHPAATVRTHCKHGHEYVEGSFRVAPKRDGFMRVCLACEQRKGKEQYDKNAEARRAYAANRRAAETPEQRQARLDYLAAYRARTRF